MQRLVAVGLGNSDVVLEPAHDRLVQAVHDAQRPIAGVHRVHDDPLILPGLQDITANVDFTAVADAALVAGLEVAGYTSQNYFLFGCGLMELLATVDSADTARYLEQVRQVKLLTLPGEMGDRFHAIALTRHLDRSLCGFSVRDARSRL